MPVIQMAFDTSGIRKGAEEATSRLASLEKQVDALQSALRKAESEAGKTGGALRDAFRDVGGGVADFKNKISGLMGAFRGLGVAAAGASIVAFQKACLESAIAMDALHQSYKTIFGSAGMEAQLDVIRKQSQSVGQSFVESAESAKTFFAAASNTSLAPQMNQIYKSVSNAGAAMHLSSEQMKGVFLALGQMVSKGKVQAEELRGQLGERLPGAFQLAAEAMGMTTAELDKFMADGKLTAEDLLPKLADVLEHKFSDAAREAADTVQGQLNRMMSAWEEFKANLAASGPATFVMRFITERIEAYNASQRNEERRNAAIAYLKKSGVKPAGPDISDVSGIERKVRLGGLLTPEDHYSDKQIADAQAVLNARDRALTWGKQALTQAKAQKEKRDALVKEAQAAFGKEALKSNKGKADANREKKAALTKQYEGARQALVVNGGDPAALARLEKGYKAAMASVDEQFAALQKRMSGTKRTGGGGGRRGGRGSGERDAERFAENTARYDAGLQKLRNEVEALEASMKPGMTTYDRMIAKINAERDAAIKNADVKAQEAIRRKQCTAAQAEETAALEKKKATLEAAHQIEELELQTLQDRAGWYREFADLSGQTGQSIALQNQLIDRQAQEWIALGIPLKDVSERVRIMKEQLATDPLSGLRRGFRTLATQAQNDAQIMESALVQTCDMMGQAFGNFVSTGKMDMESLLNSWISMINQMIAKAAMSKLFSFIGGLSFGGGGGMMGAAASAAQGAIGMLGGGVGGAVGGVASTITSGLGLLAAHGHAFSALDGYRNQIISRPTIFGYGRRLTAYAHGGIMGEAGPEAVVPLTRTRGGDLGIQADGMGAGALEVTLVIEDRTQDGVNAQATGGELDGRQLAVVVRQVEQSMVARAMNGTSPYTRYMDKSRGLNPARQLY